MAKRFLAHKQTARDRLAARRRAAKQPSRRLTFQALNDRRLLATFVGSGSSLNIALGTNENAANLSTASADRPFSIIWGEQLALVRPADVMRRPHGSRPVNARTRRNQRWHVRRFAISAG